MMDCDSQIDVGVATETILDMQDSDSMPDNGAPDSEQDNLLGLNVDHNGPPTWLNFWPV